MKELVYIPIEQQFPEEETGNYQAYECVIDCIANQYCFHHLITRAAGGPDEDWNMIPVCLRHHNEFHNHGISKMAERYLSVKIWLIEHNWEFIEWRKKWIHCKES